MLKLIRSQRLTLLMKLKLIAPKIPKGMMKSVIMIIAGKVVAITSTTKFTKVTTRLKTKMVIW